MPMNKDKKASSAMRGARTMGYGRPGEDMDVIEALMLRGEPLPDSVMPTRYSRANADEILSNERMQAMLRVIQNANRIPSPETR
jgi:hypothetical protein